MESFLDSTLLTILVVITIATLLALIRVQKRDRCLTHFDGYHVTLAEKDGRVTWGEVSVLSSGMELHYPGPRRNKKGFWQQSFLYYRDQYDALDGIYRSTAGLSDLQLASRARYIQRTANPGLPRRVYRKMRNWIGMVRDALVQTVSLLLGAAKGMATPAASVLTRDQERVSTLSAEIIGHAGNSFDPLLERHLFTRVIIDVTRQGERQSYCGYLADYTANFLEIIDAQVNALDEEFEVQALKPGNILIDGLEIEVEDDRLVVENKTGRVILLHRLIHRSEARTLGAVVPDGFVASLRVGTQFDTDELEVVVGSADRVDMLVPRTHAIVRHGVSGLSLEELS